MSNLPHLPWVQMNTVAAKEELEVRFDCGTIGIAPSLMDIGFELGLRRMVVSNR